VGLCAVARGHGHFSQADSGFLVINSVDPLGDAGLLTHVFDTSSILPVVVVLATLGVFFIAWAAASKIDSNVQREGARRALPVASAPRLPNPSPDDCTRSHPYHHQ
jgi:hypothetical protein